MLFIPYFQGKGVSMKPEVSLKNIMILIGISYFGNYYANSEYFGSEYDKYVIPIIVLNGLIAIPYGLYLLIKLVLETKPSNYQDLLKNKKSYSTRIRESAHKIKLG